MGTPAGQLIEMAGGVKDGKRLKAWTPGGSSTPFLTAEHLDTPMDFDSIAAVGSLLGTKAMIVLDERDCVVDAVLRFTQFYAHESCGKCTPCREGTWWMTRVLQRMQRGHGRMEDIDLIKDVGQNMLFKSFCALADGAVSPLDSSIKYFREEYEEHVRLRGCPFDTEERPVLEAATARTGGTTGRTAQGSPRGWSSSSARCWGEGVQGVQGGSSPAKRSAADQAAAFPLVLAHCRRQGARR